MNDAAERIGTVVIGAGQAGLAAGYHLQRAGQRFEILEANQRLGDNWRTRWGFPPPVHARSTRRTAGLALPRPGVVVPFEGCDGRLPSRRTRRGSRCRSPLRCRWRAFRNAMADTSWRRAIAASRPTTWWWPPVVIRPPWSPVSPENSTPASSNCIRVSTGTRISWCLVACSSWEPETPAPRLPWSPSPDTKRGSPAETRVTSRSISKGRRPGSCSNAWSCAASSIARSRRATPSAGRSSLDFLSRGGPLIRIKPKEIAAAGVERVARVAGVQRRSGRARWRPGDRARERRVVRRVPQRFRLDRSPVRSATAYLPTTAAS